MSSDAGWPSCGDADGADGARVHEPTNARLLDGAYDVLRPTDVDVVEELGSAAQNRYTAAKWKTVDTSRDRPVEDGRVADVGLEALDVQPVEVRRVAARLDERPDLVAVARAARARRPSR